MDYKCCQNIYATPSVYSGDNALRLAPFAELKGAIVDHDSQWFGLLPTIDYNGDDKEEM